MNTLERLEAGFNEARRRGDDEKARIIGQEIRRLQATPIEQSAEQTPQAQPFQVQPTQPASPDESAIRRGQFPASMSAFPGESFGFASPQTTPEQAQQAVGNAIRYGGPAAAMMVAAPAVGTGVAGGAILSGVGALSGYLSSLFGQKIAGEEVSQREAGADALLMATPLKMSGGFLSRAGINIPSSIASIEGSEFLRTDEYTLPKNKEEAFGRWGAITGLVGGMSYLGSRAQRVGVVEATQAKMAGTPGAPGIPATVGERFGGPAMLSEALPEFHKLEASAIRNHNANARRLMDSMDAPFDSAILSAFPEAQSNEPLRVYLRGRQEEVAQFRAQSALADNAAAAAQRRALKLSTGDDLRAYDAARRESFELAYVAQGQKLAAETAERIALGQNALNASDVNIASQIASLKNTMTAGRDALRLGIGDAYASVGIGPNTGVLPWSSVSASISSRARPGGSLEGDLVRGQTRQALRAYFDKNSVNGMLSLEGYRNLQDGIAEQLVSAGKAPDAAQRIAQDLYKGIKNSADRYIRRTMPDKWPAWREARSLAADDFLLRETDGMRHLNNNDVKGFYAAISEEGSGETLEAIGKFSQLLIRAGRPEAAAAFNHSINEVIAHGVLNKAITGNIKSGHEAITQLIDPSILLSEVNRLRVNKFPIERLGLGTPAEIRAASRLNNVKASGVMTREQLDEFLDLSSQVGADRARVRIDYYNAVRDEQIAKGTKGHRLAAYNARQAAVAARATQDDFAAALTRMENDPVYRLITDPTFKVPTGATNSAKFNASILSLEPRVASSFVEAMEAQGRGADMANLRKGLVHGVMNQRTTLPDGRSALDTKSIIDFFQNPSAEARNRRDVLQRLLSADEWKNLTENFVEPLKTIGRVRTGLENQQSGNVPTVVSRLRPPEETNVNLTIVMTPKIIQGLLDAGRYNTLYTLYVNPTTAPMWGAAMAVGGDLSSQPVLATALRLAAQQDEEDAQAQQRR